MRENWGGEVGEFIEIRGKTVGEKREEVRENKEMGSRRNEERGSVGK